ncbi:MAG TPA: hypothetical protein VFW11_09110 [Cyclobacteriaceae bacterium]|nr:hypothetical protein [Cyclobacteriaceae bacterium]
MKQEAILDLFQEEIYSLPQKPLVVIPVHWNDLNEESVRLLGKILAAVKLSASAVRVETLEKLEPISVEIDSPSHILLFGVPSIPEIDLYQPTSFQGIPVVAADALDALDDAKKKNLWAALKTMFSV